ncbi:ornithine cyclodeaminase family protein [Acidobacteria bacterium AH-259-O06]|nr:ornithine cyclodeaminase family protein [Acidobacteria bacterium AH-259-O06]
MALFLRDEDVSRAVKMDDMLEAIESMQRHFGRGEAMNLARRKIIASGGMLSVMGGGLFHDGVLGVKTYTVVKGAYSFQVSLYDANTGHLLCYTQANRLGQLRTGATTGVAVKHLSNSDSASVGIIGTGYQAPTQLEAVTKVRNIKQIKAYSLTPDRREAFAKSMTDSLGVEVVPVASNAEAIEDSEIVVCIAATTEPVVEGNWLATGATLICAGPTTWRVQEVDDATLARADKIFVDSAEQARDEAGDMASAVDRGLLQWSQLMELRYAVAGTVSGRDNQDQIVYTKLMGTGVADVAAAKLAYEKAKAMGLGMEMDW